MKNIYICLVLVCMVMVSCKKENKQTTPSDKKYAVTFGVSGFTQQHAPGFSTNSINTKATSAFVEVSSDTATTKYNVLYYILYNRELSQYTTYDATIQYQSDSGFGTYTNKLIAGNYILYIVGGQNDFPGTPGTGTGLLYVNTIQRGQVFEYDTFNSGTDIANANPNDLFYKAVTFTVGNTDISQNITLDRVVGKLDVVITDAIPSNITSIKLTITPTTYFYGLGAVNDRSFTDVQTFNTSKVLGTTNFDMSTLMLNTDRPFTVIITAYSGSSIIASKTIQNVTCTADQITSLQGNLFGGTGTGGSINVKGDTTWNVTPITYHF